ncbi:MAG: cobalamin biosynthesis protein, partial [Lachnospiraceae bacterium]|nr:cobalamin biosynthesis protein [Lachnospiraceae bacterium]
MFRNHIIAFILGFILDRIIGDPYNIPHPIRYIGSLISFFEKKFLHLDGGERDFEKEKRRRVIMCILVILITGAVTGCIIFFSYNL